MTSPKPATPSIAFVTLGCPKNTVDSEHMLGALVRDGFRTVGDADGADVAVINTCAFLQSAVRESKAAIAQLCELKSRRRLKAILVTGCLAQRAGESLLGEFPEVDAVLGTGQWREVVGAARHLLEGGSERVVKQADPGGALEAGSPRALSTPRHIAYLKISEGCDHGCAFCAIPLMRGRHRSFALGDIVHEAQLLEAQGAREINLVAQDLAHYGRDVRDAKLSLPDVLGALVRDTTVPWIRMLYLYSAGLTPALLEMMATEQRVLPYLDMPIQHASDEVLARMRRPERQRTIRDKVARIRSIVPDVAIRTTCIVGFPGETSDDFERLLGFLEETQFDRVGAFTYSAQEGTRAAELADDVPESLKRERLERLNEVQRLITAERYEGRVGKSARVLIDRVDGDVVQARTTWQADDIDGVTYVSGADALLPGTFADVSLDEVVEDVDFGASLEAVVLAPASPPRARRSLPVLGTPGSFGR